MSKREEIKKYLVSVGFEIAPSGIPLNDFEFMKRDFYLWVKKFNDKLFYFLRDKISPIKFLEENFYHTGFYLRNKEGKIIKEILLVYHENNKNSLEFYTGNGEKYESGIIENIKEVENFLRNDIYFVGLFRDSSIKNIIE